MNSTSTNRVRVESGGQGVVAHVGLHALGSLADSLGLGSALSSCIEPAGERAPRHDRGKVLAQMALVLAGGGESCADVEHLRAQRDLFGNVPSDSTVYRTFHEFDADQRAALARALADVREKIWTKVDTASGPVILDFDATLVMGLAESKEKAASTYKGGFGFHPLFCFSDLTGETLGHTLRPGNATAHNAADHVEVLDAALAQLPGSLSAGHGVGDELPPARQVIARADNAGCTYEFLAACRARRVNFFVTARANAQLQSAIYTVAAREDLWQPSRTQGGELRPGAAVCEVTDYHRKLRKMPSGTRCIVRREPLHPGAQRSLFPSDEFRYWGFYTDCEGDPAELDLTMRAHAHVEDHIQRLKESGLTRFPFTSFEANASWLMTVAMAGDLVRWFQLLCLDGHWRDARPKALRWEIFHAPGRIVHSARRVVVRLLEGWPTARQLLSAYQRIELLT